MRLYDDLLKGKSVAINVIFTECTDVCPLETATLAQLKLRDAVMLVWLFWLLVPSVTVVLITRPMGVQP